MYTQIVSNLAYRLFIMIRERFLWAEISMGVVCRPSDCLGRVGTKKITVLGASADLLFLLQRL